jgi:hypothetical protein
MFEEPMTVQKGGGAMTAVLADEPDDGEELPSALQPGFYLVPESGRPTEDAGPPIQEVLARTEAEPRTRATGHEESLPAGFPPCTVPAQLGPGSGFESGGPLDSSAPDGVLAGLADAVTRDGGLAGLADDELVGVLRTWQRLGSWCSANLMAAVAELTRRRPADRTPSAAPGKFPAQISEFVVDEIAHALTLTSRAAATLYAAALDLEVRLPVTARAQHAGLIDSRRARLIAELTRILSDEDARKVEGLIFPKATGQTTGQLRAALAKAILAVDHDAGARRREEALKDPRVRRWQEDAGTAALAGFGLPPADVLAADQRLTDRAVALREAGLPGTLEELRARAYLDALLGTDSTSAPSPSSAATDGPNEPGGPATSPAGQAPRIPTPAPAPWPAPPVAARVTLTIPLGTGLGHSDQPGTVAGFGPVDGPTARDLLIAAAAHPASRFCITLTGENGQAIGHGCLPGRRAWRKLTGQGLTLAITPLARGSCDHRYEEPGYQPSRKLQHLIQARTPTCSAPGCQRAAVRCDLDHTKPYDQGGRTCECGLAPLCRHHHRCKQSQGWRLEQPEPGVMIWTTPADRKHTTEPDSYP